MVLISASITALNPLSASASATDTAAAYQMPMASKALVLDIVDVDSQFLVAVGERGHILQSSDANSWLQANVPVQSNLNSVFFIDKLHGWAVGHDATILATQDGGVSWQLQLYVPENDKPLFDVIFTDSRQGIAVGAYGMFYRTQDGGNSWQKEFHSELLSADDQAYLQELQETDPDAYAIEQSAILPHFNRIYADGNVLYMVGEAGFAAKSVDFGKSWSRLDEFYNGSLFDIIRTPQMSLLAVGLRGHAFRSQDQGLNWHEISLPENATLNSVFADSNGWIYLTGNAGTLLISKDDGLTFTDHSLADRKVIVNGLVWQDNLVLVTEVGIKVINLSEFK